MRYVASYRLLLHEKLSSRNYSCFTYLLENNLRLYPGHCDERQSNIINLVINLI